MAWSVEDIPDLGGKVAVVTGANGGLGLATVKALAGAGAHVVMAARNQDKARQAFEEVKGLHRSADLEVVELDLGSLKSVEDAANVISSTSPRIDVLINNAGVMATPESRTADGFEMQLGVNHLGHWALTAHLLPRLLASDASRVVNVTSSARVFGKPVDTQNPHMTGEYDPWRAYSQSKLANYHFTLGLQREFDRHGAPSASMVAHPGFTNSDLQSTTHRAGGAGPLGGFFHWFTVRFGMDIDRGALSQLRAATDPDAEGGELYGPMFVSHGPPVRRPLMRSRNEEAIEALWEVSHRETGIDIDVGAALASG